MRPISEALKRIYKILWNPTPGQSPEQSGVYLTRNAHDHEWFRYFDARLGEWYMSWAEMQTRAPQTSTRIGSTELASEVVAWARYCRTATAWPSIDRPPTARLAD